MQSRRYLNEENATIISKLKLTLKSHKDPGEVSHRALHATPNYMLMGLGLWVQMMCQKRLADVEYSHILKDASGFISDIRAIEVGSIDFFVKVDFKDFYMSGEPKQIADDVASREPDMHSRLLLRDAILILLESQFLEAEPVADKLYQVIRGSGMGLVHSGFITDLSLANLAEVNWAASRAVRGQHGIKGGWRFRDDSLWVCTDKTLADRFFDEYARRSTYFVLKIEEVHSYMMRFLNVMTYKTGAGYHVGPAFKPSALHNFPLDVTSCHAPTVHTMWPAALLRSLVKFASVISLAHGAKLTVIERSGSCAIVVLIVGDICFVSNVGDSRAVLSSGGGQHMTALSRDHKPSDVEEYKRII